MRSCFLSSFVKFCSVVSKEKSKMSQPIRGQGGHLVFQISPKKNKLGRGRWDLASCQVSLNSFQRFQRRSRKCLSQWWIRGQGGHLVFPIGSKNTNLVEDVEILLPVKFRWILFSGLREVENASAYQRPGWQSCFSDRPEKHKLGRRRWDLTYRKISLNSFQRFQRRSRKCISQSEARAAILFFRSARKKNKLGRGRWDLASCQVSLNSFQRFQRRSRKCLSQWWIRGQGGHLVFPIGSKNTNLVEDVEILLPVKFHWIPFSGFRGEVENVSANQRPGWPSCFSDRPEKHKLRRRR